MKSNDKQEHNKKKGLSNKAKFTIAGILVMISILLCLCICLLTLLVLNFRMFKIEGASMEPNYTNGQSVYAKKINSESNLKRGDVIIQTNKNYAQIGRIVAIPGDKVEFKDNKVYINGSEENGDYLPSDSVTLLPSTSVLSNNFVIPSGSYLILGDNRMNSFDSRNKGLEEIDRINWKIIW